jgi:hypothetical protein
MMGTFKLVFDWNQNSVEELVIQVVSQQVGRNEKQTVGVIFPALTEVQLSHLYQHLYKKHTRLIDFVDVQETRNHLHEYLCEHWDIDLNMYFEKEPLMVALSQ